MPVALSDTDLTSLLPSAVESMGPAPSGIRVLFEMQQTPVQVMCDQNLIARVLVNLVGNAFKFSPPGGRVRVGLAALPDRVRVTVTDDGPGIPLEFRDTVFQKFGQTPQGRAIVHSSGLGLTFCKLAVEAHGGTIGIEAGDSGGACFWLELLRAGKSGPSLEPHYHRSHATKGNV